MRTPKFKNMFRKERKLMRKRGRNTAKLDYVITLLVRETPLPAVYQEHPLHGKWAGKTECHIEPDWLLIYELADDTPEKTVTFHRTGSHADLF
jgi:mRNA interferase YafQ